MLRKRRNRVIAWIVPAILLVFYLMTFVGDFPEEGMGWHKPGTDSAVAACHGWIIHFKSAQHAEADRDLLEDAQWIVLHIFPSPPLVRSWDGTWTGSRSIPLLPLVAASLVLPLWAIGLRGRWRWWREVIPAVPLLCLVVALNGTAYRQLTDIGYLSPAKNIVTAIEALGILVLIPITLTWLVFLRRNIHIRREQLRKAGGRCSQCGYNLTGLPERRCPECGREFDRANVEE